MRLVLPPPSSPYRHRRHLRHRRRTDPRTRNCQHQQTGHAHNLHASPSGYHDEVARDATVQAITSGPPVSRWQRYWFADGGRTSRRHPAHRDRDERPAYPVARSTTPVSTDSATLYRPVGMWMLARAHALRRRARRDPLGLAWASTAAMLVGLASRASAAVSFVSAVALASLSFSASRSWSHQYNVVFLAQLAFLGARGGDTLSLDALLRHAARLAAARSARRLSVVAPARPARRRADVRGRVLSQARCTATSRCAGRSRTTCATTCSSLRPRRSAAAGRRRLAHRRSVALQDRGGAEP